MNFLKAKVVPQFVKSLISRITKQGGAQSQPGVLEPATAHEPVHQIADGIHVVGGQFDRSAQSSQSFLFFAQA